MPSLLAVECREAVTRSSHPWAPSYAQGGTAAAVWALSAEALDELADGLAATGGGAPAAAAAAAAEAAPSARGLTCVACGLRFADRGAQAAHFASAAHRAATTAGSAPAARAVAADAAPGDDDDDADATDDDEAASSDDDEAGADGGALRRDARSSTVALPAGPAECASVCAAVAGACGLSGGRAARHATAARAAATLRALAAARRAPAAPAVAIVALASGRFAGALFAGDGRLLRHRALTRYTTRRGQGGAQSALDGGGKKVSSVGSMLRRQGERALADDVRALMAEWRADLGACAVVGVACAKALRPLLFGGAAGEAPLDAADARVQKLPFALARPTLKHATAAYERLATIFLHAPPPAAPPPPPPAIAAPVAPVAAPPPAAPEPAPAPVDPAAAELLAAAAAGDAARLDAALAAGDVGAVDGAGATALHVAATAGRADAVLSLLAAGADPARRDARGRPPYRAAKDKPTREAFVRARAAAAGDDARDWDGGGVPPPPDADQLRRRRERDAEKKRRQREAQRRRKAEAAAAAAAEATEAAAAAATRAERAARDDEADRCAACAGPVRGAPFSRLDFVYCTSACVQTHRRELMAAAAEARFRK